MADYEQTQEHHDRRDRRGAVGTWLLDAARPSRTDKGEYNVTEELGCVVEAGREGPGSDTIRLNRRRSIDYKNA